MNRRNFLRLSAVAGGTVRTAIAATMTSAASLSLSGCSRKLKKHDILIASSIKKKHDNFFRIALNDGHVLGDIALPSRGHGVVVSTTNKHIALVARRPGNWILVTDYLGREIVKVTGNKNRRFNGHACFSDDGRYFYTTENDFENQRGVVGVHDIHDGYKKIDELSSYGVGPHELLSVGPNTIAVANGGIHTHPSKPRKKLNLDTMVPSLVYLDVRSGQKIDEYRLNDHKLSIRHMAKDRNNNLVLALQYAGDKTKKVPLVAFHRGEQHIQYGQADDIVWQSLNHYTASAACNSMDNITAVTSPRGNRVTFWNTKTGEYMASQYCADVAGVAYHEKSNTFITSNGRGDVNEWHVMRSEQNEKIITQATSNLLFNVAESQWDNHMTLHSIGVS